MLVFKKEVTGTNNRMTLKQVLCYSAITSILCSLFFYKLGHDQAMVEVETQHMRTPTNPRSQRTYSPVVIPERPAPVVTASDDLCENHNPVRHFPEMVPADFAYISHMTGVSPVVLFQRWCEESKMLYGSRFRKQQAVRPYRSKKFIK